MCGKLFARLSMTVADSTNTWLRTKAVISAATSVSEMRYSEAWQVFGLNGETSKNSKIMCFGAFSS